MWINLKEQTGVDLILNTEQIVGIAFRKLTSQMTKDGLKWRDCNTDEIATKYGITVMTTIAMLQPFALFETVEQAEAFRTLLSGDKS